MANLHLCVLALYVTVVMVVQIKPHTAHGELTCVCTTPACNDTGHVTCSAVTACYTQYLDRRDGSSPVTRGCIDDKTPLLCENRRPFVPVTPWPHLRCCKESMCNADIGVTLTAPTWPKKYFQSTTAQVFQLDAHPRRNANQPAQRQYPEAEENFQHPFFIIVLPAVTLCLLLLLLIVVALVVRQTRRRHRTGEFGANMNAAGLPAAQCRGTFYSTGDPYIREKFFSSVPV